MMKKLFDFGNRYARQSTWKDFALTKLCLFSLGLLVGIWIAEDYRKIAIGIAACVFIVTYILLIIQMVRVARDK